MSLGSFFSVADQWRYAAAEESYSYRWVEVVCRLSKVWVPGGWESAGRPCWSIYQMDASGDRKPVYVNDLPGINKHFKKGFLVEGSTVALFFVSDLGQYSLTLCPLDMVRVGVAVNRTVVRMQSVD